MKNVLVLNGSPRGEKSNTMNITRAFCEGLNEQNLYRIDTVTVSRMDIRHCTGCFGCWTKTPGRCVLNDDMTSLLEKYILADLVIWSFPLYYFGMPSKIKAVMDRLLPLLKPEILPYGKESATHPMRYDLSHQKTGLISTCGFFSRKQNYDSLKLQFDIFEERKYEEKAPLRILCPEGELFSIPQMAGRTGAYLEHVKTAGREYAENEEISEETYEVLEELLVPPNAFIEMANVNWDIHEETSESPKNNDRAERFLRQMAAAYRPEVYEKDLIIEMVFTDLDKRYQLLIQKDGCKLMEAAEGAAFDTRIETPFAVWLDISEGKRNGAQAMMDGLYRVTGDFDVMTRMDAFFGTEKVPVKTSDGKKKRRTNMNLLLFPWIALWIFLPITPLARWGGAAAVALSALVTALGAFFALTPYDRATVLLTTGLGLAALFGGNPAYLVCLSYLGFGLLWMGSNLTKIPLTAHYSSAKYGEEAALNNPLFMKTNKIITACWGVSYAALSIISWFLMHGPLRFYTGIISQIVPILLGVFTWWFQRWYPAKVARG